jgi:hypothetical protein
MALEVELVRRRCTAWLGVLRLLEVLLGTLEPLTPGGDLPAFDSFDTVGSFGRDSSGVSGEDEDVESLCPIVGKNTKRTKCCCKAEIARSYLLDDIPSVLKCAKVGSRRG